MQHKTPASAASLATQNGQFIDPQGRQVILHGVNLVNKDPRSGYLGHASEADFAAMRRWGLNVVRLGVIWDGLEPQPGAFDEAYLQGIERLVDLAWAHGLAVFLDMHQDLYSVLYSDGAPEWATLSDGQPHVVEGGVWSDAYFTSPAVQAALDNFWRNARTPDGAGLQDHYARAWGLLAKRFAHHPAVIGYDLMNEPFPGSAAVESQYLLFAEGAALLNEMLGEQFSPEELGGRWLTPDGRAWLLGHLDNDLHFGRVVDAAAACYSDFERGQLMALYHRVAQAIRAEDEHKILFLETSMGSNMGVYSAIQPVTGADGEIDPAQVYAPHGYDLVVDTASIARSSANRVRLIFQRHGETAQRLGLPMLVGEWGAFDGLPGTLDAAWQVSQQFELLRCSDTYWAYEPGLDQTPPFQAISRPYPERIAGRLKGYRCNPATGAFRCDWQDGGSSAPTRIFLPAWTGWQTARIQLEPAGSAYTIVNDTAGNAWVSIPPCGSGTERTFTSSGRTIE